MINNYVCDTYIYWLTIKGYYTPKTKKKVLQNRGDDFYNPLRYPNFVHLNKVY